MTRKDSIDQLRLALAEWMRELRRRRGISQEVLADQLGRSQAFVAKSELAKRSISVLDLLAWCGALNLEPGEVAAGIIRLYQEHLRGGGSHPFSPDIS